MKIGLVLLMLLAGISGALGQPVVSSVSWTRRELDLQKDGHYQIAVIDVDFSEPIRLKDTDGTLHPLSDYMGGTTSADGRDFTPTIFNIGGMAKLTCGTHTFETYGNFANGPPNFLMPAPPTADTAPSFLSIMGGNALSETWLPNRLSYILVLLGQGGGGGGGGGGNNQFVNIQPSEFENCNAQLVFPGTTDSAKNPSPGRTLANAAGEVFSGSVSIGAPRRLSCTLSGIQNTISAVQTFLAGMSNISSSEQLQQMQFSMGSFQLREAWVGCLEHFQSMIQTQEASVVIKMPIGAGCTIPPDSPGWGANPCCNRTLTNTMCCYSEPLADRTKAADGGLVDETVFFQRMTGVNEDQVRQSCQHPDEMAYVLADFQRLLNLMRNAGLVRALKGGDDPWRKYMSFWETCQSDVWQKTCTLDSDCTYSGKCNSFSGTCQVDPDTQDVIFANCILAQMDNDLNLELGRLWGIGTVGTTYTTTEARAEAFAAEFRDRVYSFDCIGPRSQQYHSRWEPSKDSDGNFRMVQIPANQTGCLLDAACNWNPWQNTNPDLCAGNQVLSIYGPKLCGQRDGGGNNYRDMLQPAMCQVMVPWQPDNQNACPNATAGIVRGPEWLGPNSCIRPANNTLDSCLSSPLCSNLKVLINASMHQSGGFNPFNLPWDWRCQQQACYNLTIANQEACNQVRSNLQQSPDSEVQTIANSLWWDFERNLCIAGLWSFNNLQDGDALCAKAGLLFNEPRMFRPGQWATEEDCGLGVCSIQRMSYFGVTEDQCDDQFDCTQPCARCATWSRKSDGSEQTFCYDPSRTQSNCTSPGQWNTYGPPGNQHGACQYNSYDEDTCEDNGFVFRACGDLSKLQCPFYVPGSNSATNPAGLAWEYTALNCQWNDHTDCLSRTECESQGMCNDWEFNSCHYSSNSAPVCGAGYCVREWQVDEQGNRQWCFRGSEDPQTSNIMQTQAGCADLTVTTQSACLAKGSDYTWHSKATTESECAAHGTTCQTQWRQSDRPTTECVNCGGQRVPMYHWSQGVARQGIQNRLYWVDRQWGPVNRWNLTLDFQKLQVEIQNALASILARQMVNDMQGQMFTILPTMRILACDCGENSASNTDCVSITNTVDVTCRVDPGVASVCEGSLGSITFTNGSIISTNGSISSVISPEIYLVGAMLASENHHDQNGTTQGNGMFHVFMRAIGYYPPQPKPRSRLRMEGVGENVAPYAVIPAVTGGGIVGQVVGNGYAVPSTGINYPVQVCIVRQLDIPTDENTFPYADFSKAISGEPSVALNLSVTVSGLQYCASVNSGGTYYPIQRIQDFESGSVEFDDPSESWWDTFKNSAAFLPVVIVVPFVLAAALIAAVYYWCCKKPTQKQTLPEHNYAIRQLELTTIPLPQ